MTLTGLLVQYSYLQVLDFLSTSPVVGLALVKGAALVLGAYCLVKRKLALLQRINVMFAIVVAWNLVALIIGVAHLTKPI